MICSHTRAPPETKFPGYRQVTPPQYKSFVPSLSGTHKIFLDEPPMALTNAFVVVGSDIDHAQRVTSFFLWLPPPGFCYGELR